MTHTDVQHTARLQRNQSRFFSRRPGDAATLPLSVKATMAYRAKLALKRWSQERHRQRFATVVHKTTPQASQGSNSPSQRGPPHLCTWPAETSRHPSTLAPIPNMAPRDPDLVPFAPPVYTAPNSPSKYEVKPSVLRLTTRQPSDSSDANLSTLHDSDHRSSHSFFPHALFKDLLVCKSVCKI